MRYDEAIKSYERAISFASDRPDIASAAALALGQLYLEQKHPEHAWQAFAKAIELDQPASAIGSLAAVELGRSALAERNLEVASDYARRVSHPDVAPAAHALLGDVLVRQGNVAGAIDAFRLAIRSGNPVYAPSALNSYGELIQNQQPISAGLAFRQVTKAFDEPTQTPRAERNLHSLYSAQPSLVAELDSIESRRALGASEVVGRDWDAVAADPMRHYRRINRPDDITGPGGITGPRGIGH